MKPLRDADENLHFLKSVHGFPEARTLNNR
jgi:hypothetical protein